MSAISSELTQDCSADTQSRSNPGPISVEGTDRLRFLTSPALGQSVPGPTLSESESGGSWQSSAPANLPIMSGPHGSGNGDRDYSGPSSEVDRGMQEELDYELDETLANGLTGSSGHTETAAVAGSSHRRYRADGRSDVDTQGESALNYEFDKALAMSLAEPVGGIDGAEASRSDRDEPAADARPVAEPSHLQHHVHGRSAIETHRRKRRRLDEEERDVEETLLPGSSHLTVTDSETSSVSQDSLSIAPQFDTEPPSESSSMAQSRSEPIDVDSYPDPLPPFPPSSSRTASGRISSASLAKLLNPTHGSSLSRTVSSPSQFSPEVNTSLPAQGAPTQRSEPLSAYTCPICFTAPTHATMTPCGHVLCAECLFTAVKTTMQRSQYHGPVSHQAKCPVCRAPIPGWDGRGGGVIGLKPRAVLTLDSARKSG